MAVDSSDGVFGEKLVDRPATDPPAVGDRVRIIAGRYRSGVGELVALGSVSTPSGSYVRIATVRRPRAGDTHVFSHEIERA